jgi:hypothetical protein
MAKEEDNTELFNIHIEGDTSGKLWSGDFRAKKRLSHRSHLAKDGFRRELLGGQSGAPTERADTTAKILSELWVRLTKTPSWWQELGNGLDAEDDNLIAEIYDKAYQIELKEIEAKKKKAEQVKEDLRKDSAQKAADRAAEDAEILANQK